VKFDPSGPNGDYLPPASWDRRAHCHARPVPIAEAPGIRCFPPAPASALSLVVPSRDRQFLPGRSKRPGKSCRSVSSPARDRPERRRTARRLPVHTPPVGRASRTTSGRPSGSPATRDPVESGVARPSPSLAQGGVVGRVLARLRPIGASR